MRMEGRVLLLDGRVHRQIGRPRLAQFAQQVGLVDLRVSLPSFTTTSPFTITVSIELPFSQ